MISLNTAQSGLLEDYEVCWNGQVLSGKLSYNDEERMYEYEHWLNPNVFFFKIAHTRLEELLWDLSERLSGDLQVRF